MHLAVLVVCHRVLLYKPGEQFVRYLRRLGQSRSAVGYKLYYIKQFAGIPAAVTDKTICTGKTYLLTAHILVFPHHPFKQTEKVVFAKRLKYIHLTTAQKRCDNLKARVFRGRTDESNRSFFHCAEQTVLLRFGETVYLVYEEYGVSAVCCSSEQTGGRFASLVYHLPHLFHAACYCRQCVERPL